MKTPPKKSLSRSLAKSGEISHKREAATASKMVDKAAKRIKNFKKNKGKK